MKTVLEVAQQIRHNLRKYHPKQKIMLFCECCSTHLPATLDGVSLLKEGLERGLIRTLDAVIVFLLETHLKRCYSKSIENLNIFSMVGTPHIMHVSFPDTDRLNEFSCDGNNHRLDVPTYFFNEDSDNDEDIDACVLIKVSAK